MSKKNNSKPNVNTTTPKVENHQSPIGDTLVSQADNSAWLFKIFPWLLMVLAVAIYSNTFGHQYAFDDYLCIEGNEFTKKGFGGIWELITTDFFKGVESKEGAMELTGGRYRPLSLVTFAIEYALFPTKTLPMYSHIINVLLFAITGPLMFKVLVQWFGKSSYLPYFVALLYIVHPIHTEVVANIKSRDEILCMLFLLATLWAFWKSLEENSSKYSMIAIVTFFLSMLAKETSFMYIVVFPLIPVVFKNEKLATSVRKTLPIVASALAYFIIRYIVVGKIAGAEKNMDIMENPFVNSDFLEKHATIMVILWKYFSLNFLPHPLSADYSFNQIPLTSFSDPLVLFSLVLHLAMVAYILKKLIKIQTEGFDLLALALIMYLSPLFITSNIPFNIGAPMGERFLYIPSFGLLILVGALLQKYLKISQVKNVLGSVLLVGIALVFMGMTYSRNPVWYNNFTLFESDVEHAPNSAKMRFYYGNALLNKNMNLPEAEQSKAELEAAVEQFKKAIEINPKFHHAYYDCANTYDQLQNGNEAFKYLRKSLDLQPNHIKSTMLIGKIYGRYLNNADSSIYYLNRYVNLFHQENATGYQFLGTAYAVKGSIEFQKTQQLAVAKPYFESALKYLESALKLDPENVDALANMSVVYMSLGDIPKAEEFKKRTNDLKLKKAKK